MSEEQKRQQEQKLRTWTLLFTILTNEDDKKTLEELIVESRNNLTLSNYLSDGSLPRLR